MLFHSDGHVLIPADDKAESFILKKKHKDVDVKETGYSERQFHTLHDVVDYCYENYGDRDAQTRDGFREDMSFAIGWVRVLAHRIPKSLVYSMLKELNRAKENPTAIVERIVARSWSPSDPENDREAIHELTRRIDELVQRRYKFGIADYLAKKRTYRPA